MSERDFFKRFWISVASGIIILILSGTVTVILTNKYANIELKKDVEHLMNDSGSYAKESEVNLIYSTLIKADAEAKAKCECLEERQLEQGKKVDRHYEQIMKSLNHIIETKK